MSTTFVTPYKLTIRRKYSKDETFKLGDIEEIDCLDTMERVFREEKTFSRNDDRKEVYSVTQDFGRDGRFIFGRCELGEYGKELPIKDATNGKLSGKIKKDQAVMAPKFFMGYVPARETAAIFLFESGIRRVFEDILEERFKNYKIDLCPFASKEAWDEFYKEAMISTITVELEKSDIADNGPSEQTKKTKCHKRKLILSSGNAGIDAFNAMVQPFIKTGNKEDLLEIIDIPSGYEAKDVAIKLRNPEEQRTITTHFDRNLLVPRIVLKGMVEPSGHPTFESLFKAAFREIGLFAKKMNIDGEITNVVKNKYS